MEKNTLHVIMPDYMTGFQCIAGKCRHSCCIGWEIDIDEEALRRYMSVSGPLGEKLRAKISADGTDDAPHFLLEGEDERCPFLNEQNLCELILNLGEDSLCQICRDHPRFRNYIGDREEIGLGLCCEEAARLILRQTHPLRLTGDPADFSGWTPEEVDLYQFRSRIFAHLENTSRSLSERLTSIFQENGLLLPQIDMSRWSAFLTELERLDPAWDRELARLAKEGDSSGISCLSAPNAAVSASSNPKSEGFFLALFSYFLYRHLPAALEDGQRVVRVLFAYIATQILMSLYASHLKDDPETAEDALIECARMFSSEIEYSDENVTRILLEIERVYF